MTGKSDETTRNTMTTTDPGAQRYLDEIVTRRGYVLDCHKVMAAHDYPTQCDRAVDPYCPARGVFGLQKADGRHVRSHYLML